MYNVNVNVNVNSTLKLIDILRGVYRPDVKTLNTVFVEGYNTILIILGFMWVWRDFYQNRLFLEKYTLFA